MKNIWIIGMFLVAIVRAIVFPDYSHDWAATVIPYALPVTCAVLAVMSVFTKASRWVHVALVGLLAIVLSDAIGIVIYGASSGWDELLNDKMTHAVLIATISLQTVVYLVCLIFGWILHKLASRSSEKNRIS